MTGGSFAAPRTPGGVVAEFGAGAFAARTPGRTAR